MVSWYFSFVFLQEIYFEGLCKKLSQHLLSQNQIYYDEAYIIFFRGKEGISGMNPNSIRKLEHP